MRSARVNLPARGSLAQDPRIRQGLGWGSLPGKGDMWLRSAHVQEPVFRALCSCTSP